jgi:hypothetical protein
MAKSQAQKYKEEQLKKLPRSTGIYALCDLDEIPIYVGQSVDAIRDRVRRHLTSARSDVIANRQIDVWEIAFVWAWPLASHPDMKALERHLFSTFNKKSPLVNWKVLTDPGRLSFRIPEKVRVQVMPDELMVARRDATLRFPRQIQHFNQLVDYILNTQDKPHLRRALQVYYDRLTRYYQRFLDAAVRPTGSSHSTGTNKKQA